MTLVVVLAAFTCSLSLVAAQRVDPERPEPAPKRAWEWTLEERLAQRLDPADIQERERVYREKYREQLLKAGPYALVDPPNPKGSILYGIDGQRNPELFLPHELFDTLLSGLTPELERRQRQREFMRPAIRRFGFDDELLWAQVTSIAAAYLSLQNDHTDTSGQGGDERCRARYYALEGARQVFGQARFDEFLYTVIAPMSQRSSVTYGADPAERLRREEDGCR